MKKVLVVIGLVVAALLLPLVLGLSLSPEIYLREVATICVSFIFLGVGAALLNKLLKILFGDEPQASRWQGAQALLLIVVALVFVVLLVPLVKTGLVLYEPPPTSTPFEVRIARQASSKDAAEQYLNIVWSKNAKWRKALQQTQDEALLALVAETQPLSTFELSVVAASLNVSPTDVLVEPVALLREVQGNRTYKVETTEDPKHLGSRGDFLGFETTSVEKFWLPECKVVNGDEFHLPAREVYVVVHRIICVECKGMMRDSYLVAGLIFP